MTSNIGRAKSQGRFLPLLLAFIFIDETCNNYIFNIFAHKPAFAEFVLFSCFLLLSIIASPIQSGYSDFFCRKRSLVVSLSCSLLALVCAFFSTENSLFPFLLLAVAILAKGGLGNNLPLAWAAIADIRAKNFRFSFGLSTAAMAFGYLVLICLKKLFNTGGSTIIVLLLFMVLIYFCVRKFQDIRDRKTPLDAIEPPPSQYSPQHEENFWNRLRNEISFIIRDFLKDRRTRKALVAFMLWEISFYSALIVDVDIEIRDFNHLSVSMLLGYLLGVVLLKFSSKRTDDQMIKIGYYLSILSLVPVFVIGPFFNMNITIICCYFVYSLAAAFLAPSLFSILSRERKPHEQGKIYGLIDSSDTIAFLIASIAAMSYHFLQIGPVYLVLFSFIAFLLSIAPYAEFKKIQPRPSGRDGFPR